MSVKTTGVWLAIALAVVGCIAAAFVLFHRPRPTTVAPTEPPGQVAAEPEPPAEIVEPVPDNMPAAGALWVAPRSVIFFRFIRPGSFRKGLGTMRMVDGRGQFPRYRRDTITRGFWMGETEVTQHQWRLLMGDNPSYHNCDDCPVEYVSWYDAVRFSNALSRREGFEECYTLHGTRVDFVGLDCSGFRLPTDSEWRFALRGAEGRRFSWGEEEPTPAHENYGQPHGATTPVKSHPDGRTPEGLYGMGGNVSEWLNDWRESGLGPEDDQTDPMGPPMGDLRQWAGSEYVQTEVYLEMAGGGGMVPDGAGPTLGVRLVRTWTGPE